MKDEKEQSINKCINFLSDIIADIIGWISSLIPIKIAYFFLYRCDFLLQILFGIRKQKIIEDNLQKGLRKTNKEAISLAQRWKQHTLKRIIDLMLIYYHNPKNTIRELLEPIIIKGRENLDNALRENKGVIILSAHLGSYYLLPVILAYKGYNVNISAFMDKKEQQKIHNKSQILKGNLKIILFNHLRTMIRCLNKNELVILLGDRFFYDSTYYKDYYKNNKDKYFYYKFFDHLIYIPKSPAWLWIKTNVPLIPAALIREGDNLSLIIEKPLFLKTKGYKKEKLFIHACKLYEVLIPFIQQYPDQWESWNNFEKMIVKT